MAARWRGKSGRGCRFSRLRNAQGGNIATPGLKAFVDEERLGRPFKGRSSTAMQASSSLSAVYWDESPSSMTRHGFLEFLRSLLGHDKQ
jgi:hypothetical protein